MKRFLKRVQVLLSFKRPTTDKGGSVSMESTSWIAQKNAEGNAHAAHHWHNNYPP